MLADFFNALVLLVCFVCFASVNLQMNADVVQFYMRLGSSRYWQADGVAV
jgi:hypothetical protein